jgi:hypothetical protein
MSHTNEKGMVVGKRYMLTHKTESLIRIAILRYSDFLVGSERDKYELEYLFNVNTKELISYTPPDNISYARDFDHIIDIIDMEEIDLEYSKIKLAFARATTSENSLLYDLSNDLIDNIGEKFKELYFEACLKIYTRSSILISVIITILSVTQGRFKNGGGKRKFKKKKRKSKRRKSKKKKKSKTRRRR